MRSSKGSCVTGGRGVGRGGDTSASGRQGDVRHERLAQAGQQALDVALVRGAEVADAEGAAGERPDALRELDPVAGAQRGEEGGQLARARRRGT